MAFSRGKSRPYQLSLAAICTLMAAAGFIGAGYVGTSTADAAAALSVQGASPTSSTASEAAPAGHDAFTVQGLGINISFANTLILAKRPPAKQIFDLTDPNGHTPHLARPVNDLRGAVPEISAELISQVRKDILRAAYQGIGHRYVWGGTSFENGWDCSGFVQWVYRQAGVALPRTEQWLPMVETSNPQPGDIVVQNPDGPNHWSHIGIYLGNGKMISALNPSVGTLIHAPGDVSSSSTYFTMPAFAAADEKAKADAARNKADEKGTPLPAGTTEPAKGPSTQPGTKPAQTTPATTAPGTTAPATAPATTAPGTTPAGTNPATTAPGTTAPGTTAPPTTAPATTAPPTSPGTTAPPTTAPATTAPATSPATTAPGTTAPATTAPASTAPATSVPGTTDPATCVPSATAPAPSAPAPTAPATTAPATCVPETTAPATVDPTTTPVAAATAVESSLPTIAGDTPVSSVAIEPRVLETAVPTP